MTELIFLLKYKILRNVAKVHRRKLKAFAKPCERRDAFLVLAYSKRLAKHLSVFGERRYSIYRARAIAKKVRLPYRAVGDARFQYRIPRKKQFPI